LGHIVEPRAEQRSFSRRQRAANASLSPEPTLFVERSLVIARPYQGVRPLLLHAADWLTYLVPGAVLDALGHQPSRNGASARRALLVAMRGAVRGDVGSAIVTGREIAVPMRWCSDLERGLFPPALDLELRLGALGARACSLRVRAMYTHPAAGGTGSYPETVQRALDRFLASIAATL
jgi:hypothetical protein